jgi:cysteine desulfurase family protein (TIGR01976 family)
MEVTKLRDSFAGLDSEWALFDNAGGSQTLRSVVRRIVAYFDDCNVQHGASYGPSRVAGARVAEAGQGMADWLGAESASEVILGSSATQLLRNLALSMGRTLKPGDELIVTNCDHEANIGAWVDLERLGAKVKVWEVDPRALELRLETLEPLMSQRTRLVAFTHASNVIGRINPVREITDFVRERGALSCVDGVAFAPHRAIDVQGLGADFYALSLYKVFGPHAAALYGRRELLAELPSINHFFLGEDAVPYKFQPGNLNFELTAGLMGLWDYIDEVAGWVGADGDRRGRLRSVFDVFAAREEVLAERLLGFLRQRDGVRILGPASSSADERVCTISFVAEARNSREIVEAVDESKVGIRYGDFYAYRLIDALGLREQDGVIRASMLHYNTEDEVDRLIAALDRAL